MRNARILRRDNRTFDGWQRAAAGSSFPNLRHLQVFCAVARCQGVSAAAASVPLSQPAMTQAIAGLERYFATELFKRRNNGMLLTDAGRCCLTRVERALEQLAGGVGELVPGTAVTPGGAWSSLALSAAQLHALLAIVEHGGFSAAARGVGLSRPTIHRAAREAEALLGVPLFEATSFGICPTRAAEQLVRRARLALYELQQARAEAGGEPAAAAASTTVIGAMPLARSVLLPRALSIFAAEMPQHRVTVLEGVYAPLLHSLRSGQIDWLIGALREQLASDDVVEEHLFDDPLAIIMRAGHPLAKVARCSVRQLAAYSWIAPLRGSPLRSHFEALFRGAGSTVPGASIECNSLMVARALLLESDRLMLLSAQQIHYERRAGLLVARPHPHGRVVRRIGLTLRRDWQPTAAQRRLVELVREQTRTLTDAAAVDGVVAKPATSMLPRARRRLLEAAPAVSPTRRILKR